MLDNAACVRLLMKAFRNHRLNYLEIDNELTAQKVLYEFVRDYYNVNKLNYNYTLITVVFESLLPENREHYRLGCNSGAVNLSRHFIEKNRKNCEPWELELLLKIGSLFLFLLKKQIRCKKGNYQCLYLR